MPLPKQADGGYRGVEIRKTRTGSFIVAMSHNKHRFGTQAEAEGFIDASLKLASDRELALQIFGEKL